MSPSSCGVQITSTACNASARIAPTRFSAVLNSALSVTAGSFSPPSHAAMIVTRMYSLTRAPSSSVPFVVAAVRLRELTFTRVSSASLPLSSIENSLNLSSASSGPLALALVA